MKIRLCIIGCGVIASGWHGPSFRRLIASGEDLELVACCDKDPAKAERFREAFGFVRSYDDFTHMLDFEQPDAVSVFVSEHQMAVVAAHVLKLGIPCFMEKPPGINCSEVDQLIELAQVNRIPHQVGFNRRFMPIMEETKRLLPDLKSPPERQFVSLEVIRWNRRDTDFAATAIHGIDTVRFLLDDEFAELHFRYLEMPSLGNGVADFYAQGITRDGIGVQLHFCPVAGKGHERLAFHGIDRSLILKMPENTFKAGDPGSLREFVDGRETRFLDGANLVEATTTEVINGAYAENLDFFTSIRNRNCPKSSLESARESVVIMECMRDRREGYQFGITNSVVKAQA